MWNPTTSFLAMACNVLPGRVNLGSQFKFTYYLEIKYFSTHSHKTYTDNSVWLVWCSDTSTGLLKPPHAVPSIVPSIGYMVTRYLYTNQHSMGDEADIMVGVFSCQRKTKHFYRSAMNCDIYKVTIRPVCGKLKLSKNLRCL